MRARSALKVSKYERYARYRAAALPRIEAFRKIGNEAALDKTAHNNATRLEKRPGVKERIAYLTKQAEERIAEKRARIEERLWAIHEANIQDLFETYEQPKTTKDGEIETDQNGQMRVDRKERPRLISDLAPEVAQLIEDVTADSKGRLIPRLYSKMQASKEPAVVKGAPRSEVNTNGDLGSCSRCSRRSARNSSPTIG